VPFGKLRAHFRGFGIFDLLVDGECLFGLLDVAIENFGDRISFLAYSTFIDQGQALL